MSVRSSLPVAAFTVLLGGAALTTIGTVAHHTSVASARTAIFEEFADRALVELQDRVLAYEHGLRGTRGALLAAGPRSMTLEQFRLVNRSRDIATEFPGARGFGMIQKVEAGKDEAFLAEVAALGRSNFAIRELTPHQGERYVIKYIEPEEPNKAAVGLDVASEKWRRLAMQRALRSGQATLTRPITLAQASGKIGQGFLLILPLYPEYPIPQDESTRLAVAIGATYTPLVIDEVLANINPGSVGVNLKLTDIDNQAGNVEFYGATAPNNSTDPLSTQRHLSIFDREWLAEFQATPKYLATLPSDFSMQIALAGGVLSLLLALLVHREQITRQRQKLATERLEILIENAPTALAMFDTDMRYMAVSQRWLDDYGLGETNLIGQCHYDVFPNLPLAWKEIHCRAMAGEEFSQDNDSYQNQDGSISWLHWAIRPWHRHDGSIGGVVIFSEDVTERHRILAQLEDAKNAAEAANRAKTLFLGNMSHEMKTPLHQLNGMVAMFQRDTLTDKQTRRLDMMKTSVDRLDTVIGGILTLVDLEAKTTGTELKPISPEGLIDEIIGLVTGRASEKNLTLHKHVASLPSPLLGDPRHIKTILACYINNAITFSPQGSITVMLTCLSDEASKVQIKISVTDQGIGIPADKIDKLFENFEQVDNSHTRQYGGTGVGLAIVKKLSRLMGGDAGCESILGQGSTFWATMTLVKAESLPSASSQYDDYSI